MYNCLFCVFVNVVGVKHLAAELPDVALLAIQGERNDTGDVHVWAVDLRIC